MAALDDALTPHRLADHALRLARHRTRRGRPHPTWLRRSTSASYYALFHALAAAVADQLVPQSPAVERRRLNRSVEHGRLAEVCSWLVGRGQGRTHVQPVVARLRRNPALRDLAATFLELQEARHVADYDHLAQVAEDATVGHYSDAVQALALLDGLRGTPDGQEFLALVALHTTLR